MFNFINDNFYILVPLFFALIFVIFHVVTSSVIKRKRRAVRDDMLKQYGKQEHHFESLDQEDIEE